MRAGRLNRSGGSASGVPEVRVRPPHPRPPAARRSTGAAPAPRPRTVREGRGELSPEGLGLDRYREGRGEAGGARLAPSRGPRGNAGNG